MSAVPIGSPGCPEFACSDCIHRECPDDLAMRSWQARKVSLVVLTGVLADGAATDPSAASVSFGLLIRPKWVAGATLYHGGDRSQ
jgi:hypothetical protein